MLLNSSKEDFEDDSEESFQDNLGFHFHGDSQKNPIVNPKPER
jgi:hypothetical protein